MLQRIGPEPGGNVVRVVPRGSQGAGRTAVQIDPLGLPLLRAGRVVRPPKSRGYGSRLQRWISLEPIVMSMAAARCDHLESNVNPVPQANARVLLRTSFAASETTPNRRDIWKRFPRRGHFGSGARPRLSGQPSASPTASGIASFALSPWETAWRIHLPKSPPMVEVGHGRVYGPTRAFHRGVIWGTGGLSIDVDATTGILPDYRPNYRESLQLPAIECEGLRIVADPVR